MIPTSFTPPFSDKHTGWLVTLCSVMWYVLLFGQTAGMGLLLFTASLVCFRILVAGKIHLLEMLPLAVAISACFTATWIHWVLWIIAWAIVAGRELLDRGLPLQLWMQAGIFRGLSSLQTVFLRLRNNPFFSFRESRYWIRIAVIPVIVTSSFFCIYLLASPAFGNRWLSLVANLDEFFSGLNLTVLFSFLIGAMIGLWLLMKPSGWPSKWSFENYSPDLTRKRQSGRIQVLSTALRTEYRIVYLLLLSVNALLFAYHLIDIPWIWFQYDNTVNNPASHSRLVHEGTYLLIISILLSMAIMLYCFRGNLNFMRLSDRLRKLSYLWIVQNGFLVLSVAVRNYHYISYEGLTYKRIGVIIFLMMCLFGLATLAIKIDRRESLAKLVGKNISFGLLLGILLSALPWARWITQFNMEQYRDSGRIDLHYLSNLDGSNLDMLWFFTHENGLPEDKQKISHEITQFLDLSNEKDWRSISYTYSKSLQRLEKLSKDAIQ